MSKDNEKPTIEYLRDNCMMVATETFAEQTSTIFIDLSGDPARYWWVVTSPNQVETVEQFEISERLMYLVTEGSNLKLTKEYLEYDLARYEEWERIETQVAAYGGGGAQGAAS